MKYDFSSKQKYHGQSVMSEDKYIDLLHEVREREHKILI